MQWSLTFAQNDGRWWGLTVSEICSIAGVVTAILTIGWAFWQYSEAKKAAAEVRINAMLREMLAMKFQLYLHGNPKNEALHKFNAYRMWVLEELYQWIFVGDAEKLVKPLWLGTLHYHIAKVEAESQKRFLDAAECYNRRYLAYCQKRWTDPGHSVDPVAGRIDPPGA